MSEIIDNRAHRIRTLKHIIKHLHSGQSPDAVRDQFRTLVHETDATEIIAMEQELMAEGMPVEEIKSMCDLHSQVTRDVLVQLEAPGVPPGHPADTFARENKAIGEAVEAIRTAIAKLADLPDDADPGDIVLDWRKAYNELMDIEKHYQRKEHTLFSRLERYGINGPSKVMWAKDDEIRGLLKELGSALKRRDATAGEWKLIGSTIAEAALAAVEEMIYKEEKILLPMCQNTFTEEDWAVIWSASPRYGWCIVEPRTGYKPPETAAPETANAAASDAVLLPTGNLTLEHLTGIFSTLPVDLTFVDADDRVRFFSEGPDRVFARSKAIIGRKVQHCHPPRSVSVVDRILDDFREGRQNVAEFWINFRGRFVHIRYFAVREGGKYLGTLEVTQDLTQVRKLEGERRLLEYESPTAARTETATANGPAAQRIRHDIDADAMLATGEHPLGKVRQCAAELEAGESVRVTSGFRPVPLIDTLARAGFAVSSDEIEPGRHVTCITRSA